MSVWQRALAGLHVLAFACLMRHQFTVLTLSLSQPLSLGSSVVLVNDEWYSGLPYILSAICQKDVLNVSRKSSDAVNSFPRRRPSFHTRF